MNIAFRKLQHVVPLLHIRCTERELRQTKISDVWDTAGTAIPETIGASLKTGCGAVSLTTAYLRYPSSSWATPTRAARGTLGRAISSLGFQVGHVDLHVVPSFQWVWIDKKRKVLSIFTVIVHLSEHSWDLKLFR